MNEDLLNLASLQEEALANDLHAIGINLSATKRSVDPSIEETLVRGVFWSIHHDDSRLISLIVDWISIHYQRINVDRLTSIVTQLPRENFKWIQIFWCAQGQRLVKKDKRFRRIAELYSGDRFDYIDRFKGPHDKRLTAAYISLKGEDERFVDTCLRIPSGAFSQRPQQIFQAEEIARKHFQFRYRVMFGPTYRADIWAILRQNPHYSGYRLAKLAHCSRPSATRIMHDYHIVKRGFGSRSKAD